MIGYAALAEEIARLGVRDVFTFTAKDIVEVVVELRGRGVNVYHTRHEHIAIGMADGYSRSTGRIGVALVGQGVGMTNSLNALVTAAKAHSKVVAITSEVPGFDTHAAKIQLKHIDQRGVLDALEIRHVDLRAPGSAVADMRACFDIAERCGELVVANIADEVMQGHAGNDVASITYEVATQSSASDEEIATVADLLQEEWASRRVVILAGRGAVRSGARDDLLRLADSTGALLGTTVMAKGLFAGSPYSVGVVGTFATPVASELLHTANLVLVFGASLNYDTTYDGNIFGKARIVQFDNQPTAIGRFQTVDLAVLADARLAAVSLAHELEQRQHHAEGFHTAEVATKLADFRLEGSFVDQSKPGELDMRTLMLELDKRLPGDRAIVVDGGHFMFYPITYLAESDASGFMWPIEYSAIACGLGNALGAAIAHPERLTVLVIGDGGMMMTLADLDTAARYELPLLVVVCNNSMLFSEVKYLRSKGYSGDEVRYANPSFEALARDLGCEASTVSEFADLDVVTEKLPTLHGPMLLDCKTLGAMLLQTEYM